MSEGSDPFQGGSPPPRTPPLSPPPSASTTQGVRAGTADLLKRPSVPIEDLNADKLLLAASRLAIESRTFPSLSGIPLLAKLGQGGMGAVYFGIHPRLRLEVAVKVLPFHLADRQPELVERFFREAQVAAQVQSPHLVRVLDVNEENGLFFLVMEFVNGVSAGSYLRMQRDRGRNGLDEAVALEILEAACLGLSAAHKQGVIHRDLKPDNILIPRARTQGAVYDFAGSKIADLGLARSEDLSQSLTGSQAMMGTPGYLAPEQAIDAKHAGKPADVFSIGATLYALLTGRAPFAGTSLTKVMMDTVQSPHTPVRNLRPDVSEATAAVLDRCLNKEPQARYDDADALRAELAECRQALVTTPLPSVTLQGGASGPVPVPPKIPPLTPLPPTLPPTATPVPATSLPPSAGPAPAIQVQPAPVRRGGAGLALAALGLLALAGGAGWWYQNRYPPLQPAKMEDLDPAESAKREKLAQAERDAKEKAERERQEREARHGLAERRAHAEALIVEAAVRDIPAERFQNLRNELEAAAREQAGDSGLAARLNGASTVLAQRLEQAELAVELEAAERLIELNEWDLETPGNAALGVRVEAAGGAASERWRKLKARWNAERNWNRALQAARDAPPGDVAALQRARETLGQSLLELQAAMAPPPTEIERLEQLIEELQAALARPPRYAPDLRRGVGPVDWMGAHLQRKRYQSAFTAAGFPEFAALDARIEVLEKRAFEFTAELKASDAALALNNPEEALKRLENAVFIGRGDAEKKLPDLVDTMKPDLQTRQEAVNTAWKAKQENLSAEDRRKRTEAFQNALRMATAPAMANDWAGIQKTLELGMEQLGELPDPSRALAEQMLAKAKAESSRVSAIEAALSRARKLLETQKWEPAEQAYLEAEQLIGKATPDTKLGLETARAGRAKAHAAALLAQAETLFNEHKWTEALKLLEDAQRLDPENKKVADAIKRAQAEWKALQPQETVFKLSAKTDWGDSGVTVAAGDRLTVSAAGKWTGNAPMRAWFPDKGPGEKGTPNFRLVNKDEEGHEFFAETLIARIAESEPFYIGAGRSFVAKAAGKLSFRFNEAGTMAGLADNDGELTITIVRTPAAVGAAPAPAPPVQVAAPVLAGELEVLGSFGVYSNRPAQGIPLDKQGRVVPLHTDLDKDQYKAAYRQVDRLLKLEKGTRVKLEYQGRWFSGPTGRWVGADGKRDDGVATLKNFRAFQGPDNEWNIAMLVVYVCEEDRPNTAIFNAIAQKGHVWACTDKNQPLEFVMPETGTLRFQQNRDGYYDVTEGALAITVSIRKP
ncbi:MAG: hypothetical protein AMXMBFR7_32430 [Planctomycetota bacterium]